MAAPSLHRMESYDLNLLVALDALLQESSVTRAARRVGLSTPAMSHALARIRDRLKDPILVRSGRVMALTPRAEALRPRVRSAVEEAVRALMPEHPFVAREMDRTFVVHATDYVLTVLGLPVDHIFRVEAPSASLRFIPNTPDDAEQLRAGAADLAVGIYGDLPPEMRSRRLLTERFVCAVRKDHPTIKKRITIDQYVRHAHIQVAPRGQAGGYIDDVLHSKGLTRTVARAVPYFVTALQLTAQTDYILTAPERIANKLAPALGLTLFEAPLALRPYALHLVWHPRFDADPAHRFLRDAFVRAAREAAADQHQEPRTRLDTKDPTAGRPRRKRGGAARATREKA